MDVRAAGSPAGGISAPGNLGLPGRRRLLRRRLCPCIRRFIRILRRIGGMCLWLMLSVLGYAALRCFMPISCCLGLHRCVGCWSLPVSSLLLLFVQQ